VGASIELADLFLDGHRPDWALATVGHLLPAHADDYRLQLRRAVAYADRFEAPPAFEAAERAQKLCDGAPVPGVPPCDEAVRGRITLLRDTLDRIKGLDMRTNLALAKDKIFEGLHPVWLMKPGKQAPKNSPEDAAPAGAPPRKTFNGDWVGPLVLGTTHSWIEFQVSDDHVLSMNGFSPKGKAGQAIYDGSAGHIDLGDRGILDGPVDLRNNLWTAHWLLRNAPSQNLQLVRRPQTPVGPFPYRAENITFRGADGAVIAGTVTAPADPGPHPAVVLITGSNPADRDDVAKGQAPSHRPFAVWADQLTRQGFVVLRYDSRGVGYSGGDALKDPEPRFAQDVAAAVALLKTRPDVDARKVGLIGHGAGGVLAGQVAAADPTVAFVVLLNAPGRAAAAPGPSAYSAFFTTHDPAGDLARINRPILVVDGEKDTVFPPDTHLPAIQAALRDNVHADVCVIPGLGHELRRSTSGAADEAEQSMITVDPTAIGPVVSWLAQRAQ